MGYAGSASAVGPGYLGNLTGNTYNIGNTFSALVYGSSFVDTYLSDIAPTSVTVGRTATINLDIPFFPAPEFELSNMSIKFTAPPVSQFMTLTAKVTLGLHSFRHRHTACRHGS